MTAVHYELHSFVNKFVSLWQSGCDASLHIESKAGNAFLNLQLGLGQAKAHPHAGCHRKGGPARQRRRAKREAERQARVTAEQAVMNEKATTDDETEKEAEKVVTEAEVEKSNLEKDISEKDIVLEKGKITAENALTDFKCEICDFSSNWKNGLEIHMSRKHSSIEQLDGNSSLSLIDEDKDDDQKYLDTLHYWKSGRLSSVYQTFLDANEIIDKSNFAEDVKKIEKEKILEARKSAFGNDFKYYPPWRNW